MSRFCLLLLTALAAVLVRVEAVESKARSISSSKQFVVFCDDTTLRSRVVGFAEQVKTDLLVLLGESDRWKAPIVITLQPVTPGESPAQGVRLLPVETPGGTKIELDVWFGDKPAEIHLQKHLVRAVLLEMAYRDRGGVKGGESYVEAPWWLVEGALQLVRQRESGIVPDLFLQILETNKLPPLADFLLLRDPEPGTTAQAIDGACATCLVQLLIDQPSGRANLSRLVRRWPQYHDDPVAGLMKEFPSLGEGKDSLQKWWTLSVARFSAADRHRALSAEATDRDLAALLEFEIVINKAGEKKKFVVGEFRDFVKLPASKAVLVAAHGQLVALSTRANALLRPVVADYEQIFALLLRAKTRSIATRIETAERYRETMLHRMAKIADYLNWYEATQFGTRSGAFDGYLKAAQQISAEEERIKREDPIAQYLDQLEQEF